MLHNFLCIDKSPILNFSKKGLAKAGLLTAVILASTSISTGVLPLTVAGVTNVKVAEARIFYIYNGVLFYSQFPVNWNEAKKIRRGWWDYGYANRYCQQMGGSNYAHHAGYCGFYAPAGNNKPNQTAMLNVNVLSKVS